MVCNGEVAAPETHPDVAKTLEVHTVHVFLDENEKAEVS